MSMNEDWPPEGCAAVGDYAFELPLVPTELQLEQVEEFVFTQEAFLELDDDQRRRNVIRLAIAAAWCEQLPMEEGSRLINIIPLIGGMATVVTERHDGTAVFRYSLPDNQ